MLPLCHAMGRNLAITMPLIADIVPHYPEAVDAFTDALYEIQPTFVLHGPALPLQKFAAHLLVGLDQSSWIKRAAYQAAMRVARRALERRWRDPRAGRRRCRSRRWRGRSSSAGSSRRSGSRGGAGDLERRAAPTARRRAVGKRGA